MTITVPGYSTITGNAETIVRVMKSARFFNKPMSIDDYIEVVQRDAERIGAQLTITGDTQKERAESLLKELAKHNMITIKEEE